VTVETAWTRLALRIWVVLVLAFLFVPILIIMLYAFNTSTIQSWPLPGFTFKWFPETWNDPEVREAFLLSIRAGLIATAIALVLGTAASFAVHRFRFFGREVVSFVVVLPLALPGIITGMALNSFFYFNGINLSLWTIVIGHATFCIVIVYNNVIARLRRTSPSLIEASMDLGAHGWTTFRTVTFPLLSTALVAGALLAFALSFDEVIVTTFTSGAQNTLPLWIFGAIRLGQRLPEVNVVVFFVVLFTVVPVTIAARLTGGGGVTRASASAAAGQTAQEDE
jgi:putative spermidine/putrescine transport system permease protein